MAKVCLYKQQEEKKANFPSNGIRYMIRESDYYVETIADRLYGEYLIDGLEVVGGKVFDIFELSVGTHTLSFKSNAHVGGIYGIISEKKANRTFYFNSGEYYTDEIEFEVKEGNNYFILTGQSYYFYVQSERKNQNGSISLEYKQRHNYPGKYDLTLKRSSASEFKALMDRYGSRSDIAPYLRERQELKDAMAGTLTPNASLMNAVEAKKTKQEANDKAVAEYFRRKREKQPIRTFFEDLGKKMGKVFKPAGKKSVGFKLLYTLATILSYVILGYLGAILGSLCRGSTVVSSNGALVMYIVSALYAVGMAVWSFIRIWGKSMKFSWVFMGITAGVLFILTFIGSAI